MGTTMWYGLRLHARIPQLTSHLQPLNIVQEKVKLDRSSSQRNASAPSPAIPPPKKAAAPAFDLIGGDDVPAPPARPSTTDAPGAAVRPPPAKPPPTSSQLLGGLGGDFFGGGGGGQPERPSSASSKPAGLSRPDLKQSILSLYASSPKPQSQPAPSNPAAHERQSSVGGQQPGASSSAFGGLNDAFSGLNFGSTSSAPSAAPTATQTPQISQAAKPSPFASFGQPPAAAKSIPAPPQISSPLGGGGFFDTGPKPPPKPSGGAPAKASTVPPPLSVRKISNASDGFGDFSAAVPHTASSAATSSNGLLDLSAGLPSQPSTAGGARTSNPVATHSSIFNLGGGKNPSGGGGGGGMPALKAPPNYNALAQSSAPPTKSSFATPLGAADPWGANEWATPDPAPAVSNAGPKSPAGGSGTDFGWGAAPAAASSKPSAPPATTSMQADWGAPSPAAAAPAKQSGWATSPVASSAVVGDAAGWGFGDAGASASAAPKPAPRVTAEEDFGDWGSAAQPAVPPAGSGAGAGAGAKMPAGEDLFSNVWE